MVNKTYPDPHQFTIMHRLLHSDGTHALCIQAEWLINYDDWRYLRTFNESLSKLATFIIEPHANNKDDDYGLWRIFDIPVRIVHPYEVKVPQLIFKMNKRVW